MKRKIYMAVCLCAAVFSLLAITSCRMQPVMNIQGQSISQVSPIGSSLSQEQIQKAILQACKDREWNAKVTGEGIIEANITVRGHYASVQITYNTSQYSINYLDSRNLQYNGYEINKYYNSWVRYLAKSIDAELSKVR